MSVGPLGNTGALSGAQTDAANQSRRARADQKTERSESLGETDADQETSDRDADGRRIWEKPAGGKQQTDTDEDTGATPRTSPAPPQSKDPTGASGGLLDLTG